MGRNKILEVVGNIQLLHLGGSSRMCCCDIKILFLESIVCVDSLGMGLGRKDKELDLQCKILSFPFSMV